MKRLLCFLLAALMLCTALIACDKEDGGDTPPEPVHTHAYGEWSVSVQGTCTTAGEETRSCECGAVETRTTTTNHTYNAEDICTLCQKSKVEIRLSGMALKFENEYGKLYFDEKDGSVGYWNASSGEVLFTNPARSEAVANDAYTADEMVSQIVVRYPYADKNYSVNTYADAMTPKSFYVTTDGVENGICVGYRMRGVPVVAPEFIEKTAFEEKILKPLKAGLIEEYGEEMGSWHYNKFNSYYRFFNYTSEGRKEKKEALAKTYPVLAEKNVDAYLLGTDALASERIVQYEIAVKIAKYCPEYTLEELKKDHAFLKYEAKHKDLCVELYGALSFVIDENGLTVDFAPQYKPENGPVEDMREGFAAPQGATVVVLPYLQSLNREDVHILCQGQGQE